MAIPAYMTIEGENQGEISSGALSEESVGTANQEGHEDQILIQAFQHSVPRATNISSGQITGLPQMKPMRIIKMIDKSSPLLHNALVTGEQLTIEIEWFRISSSGEEEMFYMLELENAVLVDIKTVMENVADPAKEHFAPMEELYITAGTIRWTHDAGGTEGEYTFGASA